MSKPITIPELLQMMPNEQLVAMYKEFESGVMPINCVCRTFNAKVNRLIDMGKVCINPSNYSRIYSPGMSKLVYQEMARRYLSYLDRLNEYPLTQEAFDDFMKGLML